MTTAEDTQRAPTAIDGRSGITREPEFSLDPARPDPIQPEIVRPELARSDALRSPVVHGGAARRRSRSGGLGLALVAFLLGAGAVGALAWRGDLARVLPMMAPQAKADDGNASAPSPAEVTSLETRLALLEDRFSRLNQQADAAAGNAGRAEKLLITQATRRAIERGQPLGYLADQLRLRFADAQPRAVQTLIAFSQRPVTLSTLNARLDTLTPQLANLPRGTTSWNRVRSTLAALFTIRSDASPTLRPEEQIERAKLLLASGNIDAATDTVARLPGASAADDWSVDARRFAAAEQALDVIESAALVTPTRLTGAGQPAAASRTLPD